MVLSKRERYIALATCSALGLLVLDHFVLTPLLEAREYYDTQVMSQQKTLSEARNTIKLAKANKPRWQEMQKSGLRRHDAAEAESEVMKEIRSWAQQAGLNLSLLKAERSEKEKEFQRSLIRVTVSGGMSQMARFLWHIQTASIPVQFGDVNLNTHKEGTDDLTLQLALATIYLLPDNPDAVEHLTTAPTTREAIR